MVTEALNHLDRVTYKLVDKMFISTLFVDAQKLGELMKLEDPESTFTTVYIVIKNVTQILRIVYEIK